MKNAVVQLATSMIDGDKFEVINFSDDKITLFKAKHVDEKLQNYYYFLEVGNLPSDEVLAEIETSLINVEQTWETVKAINRYIIVLMKIEILDSAINKKIIEIEDNEYMFNKYVLFYTTEEEKEFIERLATGNTSISADTFEEVFDQIYMRILIKIPFLSYESSIHELMNIDDTIQDGLKDKKEKYEHIRKLDGEKIEKRLDEILNNMWEALDETLAEEN